MKPFDKINNWCRFCQNEGHEASEGYHAEVFYYCKMHLENKCDTPCTEKEWEFCKERNVERLRS